jgi:hypothetical protein
MLTKDNIRDAASTLAHHWVSAEPKDRVGVERIIRAYPAPLWPALCAHIMRYLELRGWYVKAEQFEALLFDFAGELVAPDDPFKPEPAVDPVERVGQLVEECMRNDH